MEQECSGTEERVAVVLVQEECRVRPRLGRLREQKAIEEWIKGSGGMCHFCRPEYTGTGQSLAPFVRLLLLCRGKGRKRDYVLYFFKKMSCIVLKLRKVY